MNMRFMFVMNLHKQHRSFVPVDQSLPQDLRFLDAHRLVSRSSIMVLEGHEIDAAVPAPRRRLDPRLCRFSRHETGDQLVHLATVRLEYNSRQFHGFNTQLFKVVVALILVVG